MPYCAQSELPHYHRGFARLRQMVGDTMGDPIECQHYNTSVEPRRVDQLTTTGLAYWRAELWRNGAPAPLPAGSLWGFSSVSGDSWGWTYSPASDGSTLLLHWK